MAERGNDGWPVPVTASALGRARAGVGRARPAALPVLTLVVLACLDTLTTPRFAYLPLLSLGPAFAAIALHPLMVVLIGCAGVALWFPMVSNDGLFGSFQGYVALATIIGATLAAMATSAGSRRRDRELANVRAVAEVAEQVLLRPVPTRVGRVRVAAQYLSAAPSSRIGGDVYDLIRTGDNVRVMVGDVQGKGLVAVRTAAVVLGAFRESAYDAPALADIARRIEASLEREAAGEEFVTAILAQMPLDGAAVEILNCGHPPPLVVSAGAARFAEPPQAGLPIGLARLAPSGRRTHVVPFLAGDRILLYTDGISEARDASGTFYPLARSRILIECTDPAAALRQLREDVVRHAGGVLRDDAAMLLICRGLQNPGPGR